MKNLLCLLSLHNYKTKNYQRPLVTLICSRCGHRHLQVLSKSMCETADEILQGDTNLDKVELYLRDLQDFMRIHNIK